MKAKTLLIFILVGFLAFAQYYFLSKLPKNNYLGKRVAGISNNIPEPDRRALVRPPEKISGFEEPRINAKAVYLMDLDTKKSLYEKNANEKVAIASTTKIMTAIVVLENYEDRLNENIKVTYPMIAVDGSDIKLVPGEEISVNNLLKGLLIMSGNDTAYALAIGLGAAQSGSAPEGGKDNFIQEMNQKALKIGMENTSYKDPAGLDDDGRSTAKDLALLSSYALRNGTFAKIVSTPEETITSTDGRITHELKNSNRMIKADEFYFYQYAIGIKTGFTDAAGHCLVSGAKKNDHLIIGVVLNTNENTIQASAKESKKLLEWGFANYKWSD